MAHNVSNEYKQVIYSGDARNKLKILFNNVELEDADRYCERMTVKSRIVPNGAKIFSLNNFISKEVELILHNIDTSIIKDQISISIGTLVGNSYEYVPIGIFNIQDTPTNDKRKTTIKLRDNSVKFDFNYNAQPLIEENGGSATKLQILQDMCSQAGVTCNITSFIGYLDEIGVYDNTITAREYISRIAEQAGKIATINRSGELIFVDLNNLTTWEIPIEIVEKYENGTKYKIGRVVYEDGIVRYETPTSNDDTLFLDGSNNYISGELVKEQASSSNNSYYLENTSEADLAYLEVEGKTTQETRSGKNFVKNSNINYSYTKTSDTPVTQVLYLDDTIKSLTANTTLVLSYYLKRQGTYTELTTDFRKNRFGMHGNLVYKDTDGVSRSVYPFDSYLTKENTGSRVSMTYTLPANLVSIVSFALSLQIGCRPSDDNNNTWVLKEPQLEVGTSATGFEEYGAQPSPDYPSELVSVGYENLFGVTLKSGVTIYNTGAYSTANARLTSDDWIILEAGTYTFNAKTELNKILNVSNVTFDLNNNFYEISGFSGQWESLPLTFTLTQPIKWKINLKYTDDSVMNTTEISEIQLTKGTQAHSYIPYGKYGVEVKTNGKNLRDNATWYSGYLNNNNQVVSNDTWKYSDYIDISSGNFIYSSGGSGGLPKTILYDENKQPIEYIDIASRKLSIDNNNAKYIRISVAVVDFNNLLLRQENNYLYTLDNPLRSTEDTKDLLYIKNGMLYVDRKIGSVILNGSESGWIAWKDAANHYNYYTHRDDIAKTVSSCISNYFKYSQTSGGTNNIGEFQIGGVNPNKNGNIVINPFNDTTNQLATFKTWLSTHNTEVQYILAEPYTEELGTIEVPSTYEEITYIDISSNINTNTYLQYREDKTQVEAILNEVDEFDIDSLKTGKILGNPAIDSYDLIQITDGNKIFKTLATNDLVYTGVLINTFDTQIGEEAKEQNVFINGEETFKKWARTSIDNVEGSISLQAGKIDEANDRINTTNLTIDSQGALLNVLANNSNIDVQYDSAGNPLSGEVREVTTTTGFKFNAEGMTIEDTSSNFKALHRNTGVTYYDGTTIVGQYTKDGSKQKDLELFGVYYYGKEDINDTPMFVAQLYTDKNGEECFGHFVNKEM